MLTVLIVVVMVLGVAFFIRKGFKSLQKMELQVNNSTIQTVEEKLMSESKDLFIKLNKNKNSNGLGFIQTNSDMDFFDTMKEKINKEKINGVIIDESSLNLEILGFKQELGKQVCSIRYTGNMEILKDSGSTKQSFDEVWTYLYRNSRWIVSKVVEESSENNQIVSEQIDVLKEMNSETKPTKRFNI